MAGRLNFSEANAECYKYAPCMEYVYQPPGDRIPHTAL